MYREKYTGVERSVLGKKNLVFNELVFRTDADSQALKTYGLTTAEITGTSPSFVQGLAHSRHSRNIC